MYDSGFSTVRPTIVRPAAEDRATLSDTSRGVSWAMGSIGGLSWWLYILAYPYIVIYLLIKVGAASASGLSIASLLQNGFFGETFIALVIVPGVLVFLVALVGLIRRRGRKWAIWAFVLNLLLAPIIGSIFVAQYMAGATVVVAMVSNGIGDNVNSVEKNVTTDLANVAYAEEFNLANTGSYASLEVIQKNTEEAIANGGSAAKITISEDTKQVLVSVTSDPATYTLVAVASDGKVYMRDSSSGETTKFESVEEYRKSAEGTNLPVIP